jgi:DNA-binding GntR family transcriptional regulator
MSQTTKAIVSLRELILHGEIAPGEQLLEVVLVDRLGVSRTPIRAALAQLAQEGLLEKMPGGGYAVRKFTHKTYCIGKPYHSDVLAQCFCSLLWYMSAEGANS